MIQKWFSPSDTHSPIKQKGIPASKIILTLSIVTILFYAIYSLPYYGDWDNYYYHVGQSPLDPYAIRGFFNPPWMALVLAPFTIFSVHLSGAIWMTLAILLTLWSMHRLQSGILGRAIAYSKLLKIRYSSDGKTVKQITIN